MLIVSKFGKNIFAAVFGAQQYDSVCVSHSLQQASDVVWFVKEIPMYFMAVWHLFLLSPEWFSLIALCIYKTDSETWM